MKVDFLVCGKFHYLNYFEHLSHFLDKRIFLSTSIFKKPKSSQEINFPAKEYILQGLYKIGLQNKSHLIIPMLHRMWAKEVMSYDSSRRDIGVVLHHGVFGTRLVQLRDRYKYLVFEAVNSHPYKLHSLLGTASRDVGYVDFIYPENKSGMVAEVGFADSFLFPSRFCMDSYLQYLSSEQIANSQIIPYPVQRLSTHPSLIPMRNISLPIKVVFVGQLTLRKGVFYLLEAIENISRLGLSKYFKFDFYGVADSSYFRLLKKRFGSFNYHGHISREKVQLVLRNSDVLCLPSVEDGFGLVVSEAINAGARVVVSKSSGASEVIDQSRHFIVDPCCSQQIVDALLSLLSEIDNSPDAMRSEIPDNCTVDDGAFQCPTTWREYASIIEEHLFSINTRLY